MSGTDLRERATPGKCVGLSLSEQTKAFLDIVRQNPVVTEILRCLPALALPDGQLTSGCLFQTTWNAVCGFPPTNGIKDYDVFYFDDRDLSYEAEDRVIRRCDHEFKDLGVIVEVRNQARVHLWYEGRFGKPRRRIVSTADGINGFSNCSSCFGIRPSGTGEFQVHAPYGFHDLFNLTLRPNPAIAPREVYEKKAKRWMGVWPDLTLLRWRHNE